jgi:flagellar motility protein MotE (MotC chaperone)
MGALRAEVLLAGLWFAGVMLPANARADDKGWSPIVVQTGSLGAPRYQPYQPVQPMADPLPHQKVRPQRQRTPEVWRSSDPAYQARGPRAAQVNRPTLTDHGLQMPVPPGARVVGPGLSEGYGPGEESVVPPLQQMQNVQQHAGAEGDERAVVAGEQNAPGAAKPVEFNHPVGAIPVTRPLSKTDSARLKVAAEKQGNSSVEVPDSDLARRYCVNVADAAADARFAWQKSKIAEAEKELDRRIAALEAKTAEYKAWLARRDAFARKANEKLVQIYAQMEPDAGAAQLASMDEETAASVLAKLDPQYASAILNEMQPEKGARLTATIAGAARVAARRARQQQVAQQPQAPEQNAVNPAAQGKRNGDE